MYKSGVSRGEYTSYMREMVEILEIWRGSHVWRRRKFGDVAELLFKTGPCHAVTAPYQLIANADQ